MAQTTKRRLLRPTERQAQILRAASRAFARGGFAATSMDDVAAEAGITRLIVYRHFASKEVLYRAVLTAVADRLRDEFLAGMAGTAPRRPGLDPPHDAGGGPGESRGIPPSHGPRRPRTAVRRPSTTSGRRRPGRWPT